VSRCVAGAKYAPEDSMHQRPPALREVRHSSLRRALRRPLPGRAFGIPQLTDRSVSASMRR
jgi:hypothetical protein